MFIKETRRRRKDGSEVVYLQLVVSQWDARRNTSRQRVLYNLGRKDKLDREALARMVHSFSRYLEGPREPLELHPVQTSLPINTVSKPVKEAPKAWDQVNGLDWDQAQVRPLGVAWLLRHLVGELLQEGASEDRALLTLLHGRATHPTATLSRFPDLPWLAGEPLEEKALWIRLAELRTSMVHPWSDPEASSVALYLPQSCSWTAGPTPPWIALTLDQRGQTLHHQVWSRSCPEPPSLGQGRTLTWRRWERLPLDLIPDTRRFLWQLSPQAHPDFEALLHQRGRYRKINQVLSFRHSAVQIEGRRLLALLVRTRAGRGKKAQPQGPAPWSSPHPWSTPTPELQLLLTDDHHSDPEALILASQQAQVTLARLGTLRSASLARHEHTGHEDPDLWLDLMAVALIREAERTSGLTWEALQNHLDGLQALRHPDGHHLRLGWRGTMEEWFRRLGCPPPPARIDL